VLVTGRTNVLGTIRRLSEAALILPATPRSGRGKYVLMSGTVHGARCLRGIVPVSICLQWRDRYVMLRIRPTLFRFD